MRGIKRERTRQMRLPLAAARTWGGARKGAGRKPRGRPSMPHVTRSKVDPRFPVQVTIRATPGLPSLRSPRVFGALRRAIARASFDRFRVIHFSIQQDHAHFIVEGDEARRARGGVHGLAIRLALAVNRALGRKGKVVGDAPATVQPDTWMARVGWRRAGGPLRVDEQPAAPPQPRNLNPRMSRRALKRRFRRHCLHGAVLVSASTRRRQAMARSTGSARSGKRSAVVTSFDQKTRVDVELAQFKVLASVRHLDVAKLAREGSTSIEVGFFETDCCHRMVRAVVRKGMVTELLLEPCDDKKMQAPSPELVRLFELARRRLPRARRSFRGPMPLAEFLDDVAALTVETITCIRICILGFCFVCCTTKIPNLPVVCGEKVIVVRF